MGEVALPCCRDSRQIFPRQKKQKHLHKRQDFSNPAATTNLNVRGLDDRDKYTKAAHRVDQLRNYPIKQEEEKNEVIEEDEKYEKDEISLTIHEDPKETKASRLKKVEVNRYTLIKLLGQGGFGKVFLGCLTKTAESKEMQLFALKKLKKSEVKEKGVLQNINLEKQILKESKSDFITRLHSTFRDSDNYYIVMEWAEQGDLHSFLEEGSERRREFMKMQEDAIRFILGCVILGLEELHSMNIVYSDLKPSNILIFSDGYAKLADFGVSVLLKKNTPCTFRNGTKRYFAPEMVMRTECKRYVDLWALGVLAYELSNFISPFMIKDIEDKQRFKKAVDSSEKERYWNNPRISEELKQFINKLLRLEPRLRLGVSGSQGLKNHAFFKKANFDWQALENKTMKSPLIQILGDNNPQADWIDPFFMRSKSVEVQQRSVFETIQNWSTSESDK